MNLRLRLNSILPTPVHRQTALRLWSVALVAALLCGCAVVTSPPIRRIALLAPFEGRYREVGYDALYAGRLAFADADRPAYEFLPVDDGGTPQRAADRARALVGDSSVVAVIVLGYHAASDEALAALGDMPTLIVGSWTTTPPINQVYILSNPDINDRITAPPTVSVTEAARLASPVMGGEVFALPSFAELRGSLEGVMVLSSGSPADAAFAERYRASDPFAPPPGLLTTLTYDAVRFVLQANQPDRESVDRAMNGIAYSGLNGTIQLADGYWLNAPIHRYRYVNGQLTAADDVVEQRQRFDWLGAEGERLIQTAHRRLKLALIAGI